MKVVNLKMIKKIFQKNKMSLIVLLSLFLSTPKANSAEKLSLVNGIFSRSIEIKHIDHLAKTGEAKGSLKNLLKLSSIKPKDLQDLLSQKYKLPLVTTSKLMYSKIGKVIILRVAEIIHPHKITDNQITLPAIRSGVINGIVKSNGELTLMQFIKSYPNKVMAINIPSLKKVLNKVDSMSELISFFSNSPLEKLKNTQEKALD